jgi:hypothetical protein
MPEPLQAEAGKSLTKTVFCPFFTVFDRFPDRREPKFIRRFKGWTVFSASDGR